MALKDWIKFSENSWIKRKDNYGNNPHTNGILVGYSPIVYEWINGKAKHTKNVNFEIWNKAFVIKKQRTSKSLALKFAKSYMRTH